MHVPLIGMQLHMQSTWHYMIDIPQHSPLLAGNTTCLALERARCARRPQITFKSCGISMNNGITGDNDLNLALDVSQGQMNYSAITNSSTCFIVRAQRPRASLPARAAGACPGCLLERDSAGACQ